MRKKILAAGIAAALLAVPFSGSVVGGLTVSAAENNSETEADAENGGEDEARSEDAASGEDEADSEDTAEASSETGDSLPAGSVLNIECFNEEFKTRVADHYPGYIEIDGETGMIGDVTVRWTITSTDMNAYQDRLDRILPDNEHKDPDERVDIFLAEDSFLGRYVDAKRSVTVPIENLGITEDELSEQFPYTLEAASDRSGNIRGLTWQCTPGVLIYNRAIAEKVFGTTSPAEIQKHVKTWDKFMETAEQMLDAGYSMTASAADTFQAYAGSMSDYWISREGEIKIPDNINSWIINSKDLVESGASTTSSMWSADWSAATLMPEGNVFCCFGPEWMIRYCLSQEVVGSIANTGGWAVCQGPAPFFWRGTWMFAARGTDNAELIADIMRAMTTDEYIMANIRLTDGDFVNNRKVMEADAENDIYALEILGGQNPTKIFIRNADRISGVKTSRYDEICEAAVRGVAKKYFEGSYDFDQIEPYFVARVENNAGITQVEPE